LLSSGSSESRYIVNIKLRQPTFLFRNYYTLLREAFFSSFFNIVDIDKARFSFRLRKLIMLTTSSVGDQEWNAQALSSDEENDQQANGGTVFQNNQTAKSTKWTTHLNDLFEYPSSNRLSDIFTIQDDSNAVKAKDLFSTRHDTLTRKKLKGIIDSIDSKAKDSFEWPEQAKEERSELLNAKSDLKLDTGKNEEFDFGKDLEQLSELKIESLATQQIRRPKSAPKIKTISQPLPTKICTDKVEESLSDCLNLSNCHLESITDRKKQGEIYTKFKLNNNSLEFLDEIDATAQLLQLSNNSLSDITSFSHLQALSNLDISNNSLNDLSG
jgi:hypothetical protein